MIYAYCKELNTNVFLGSKLLKKYPTKYTWNCLDCNKVLIYILKHKRTLPNNEITYVREYLRHKSKGNCAKETPWHHMMKKFIFDVFSNFDNIKDIKTEHRTDNQKPDTLVESFKGRKVAFEYQHSYIQYDKLDRRSYGFNEKNMYPSWILDGEKKNFNLSEMNTTQLDRNIFKMYRRIYYAKIPNIDFNLSEIIDVVEIYCVYILDENSTKAVKKIISFLITDLKIEFKTINQLKHARFVSKEMDNELKKIEKLKEEKLKKEELRKKKYLEEQELRYERENLWETEKKEIESRSTLNTQTEVLSSQITLKPLKEIKFELIQIEKNYQTNKSIFVKNRTLFVIGRSDKYGKKIFFVSNFYPRLYIEKDENIDYIIKECKKNIKEIKDEGYRNLGGTIKLLTIYVYKTTDVYEKKSVYTFDKELGKTIKKVVQLGIRDKFAKTYEANIKFTEVFKRAKLIKNIFYVPEYVFKMITRTFKISGIEYVMIKENEIDGGKLIF